MEIEWYYSEPSSDKQWNNDSNAYVYVFACGGERERERDWKMKKKKWAKSIGGSISSRGHSPLAS